MNPGVQIKKVRFEILAVLTPAHAIDARGGIGADRPVGLPQAVDVHVMKERGEPHIPVRLRLLAHALQLA